MGAVCCIRSADHIMKLLIIVCLVAASQARPSGSEEEKDKHGDRFIIRACLSENWKEGRELKENMEDVMGCIKCFTEIEDYESQAGIDTAKACVSQHLPWEQEACQNELDALTLSNEESGEAVIECMEEWQYGALAEWCLTKTEATEAVEQLTDGTMCILESIKNVTQFSFYVHHMNDGNRRPKKFKKLQNGGGKDRLKNYVMKKLLPVAACDAANMDDQARLDECKQCFESVTRENHKTKALECSNNFLMPYYQDCEESMNSLNENSSKEEKKAVKKCYIRGVVKSVVMRVNPDGAEATPVKLLETFEEGHEYVMEWVEKNARPEFAKRIIQFLDDDDDQDDDDDEE